MDRAMIETHLAQAERHVAEGAERIRRQHEILRELVDDKHSETARKAALLLKELEETQAAFIADRDRLVHELARLSQD